MRAQSARRLVALALAPALGGLLGCVSSNGTTKSPTSTPDGAGADTPRPVGTGEGGADAGGDSPNMGTGGAADAAGADRPARGDETEAGSTDTADRGSPDAAPVDASLRSDAPANSGCPGVFCEDFERGVLDATVWDIKVNGGQPAPQIVSQLGLTAHGKYAAHFHANPNVVSYDFISTKAAPAALAGHHFGRAYFMITPMPPTNHTEYIYAGTTGFPQYRYLEVASAAPLAWQLTYVDLAPPTTGEDYHSGGSVPTGRWICLEWEFNDVPEMAAVFVDGSQDFAQSTFTFNGVSSGLVGGFAAFGFGFYAWHPATYAFDVYYDDIVLDTKRVGCLPH